MTHEYMFVLYPINTVIFTVVLLALCACVCTFYTCCQSVRINVTLSFNCLFFVCMVHVYSEYRTPLNSEVSSFQGVLIDRGVPLYSIMVFK